MARADVCFSGSSPRGVLKAREEVDCVRDDFTEMTGGGGRETQRNTRFRYTCIYGVYTHV